MGLLTLDIQNSTKLIICCSDAVRLLKFKSVICCISVLLTSRRTYKSICGVSPAHFALRANPLTEHTWSFKLLNYTSLPAEPHKFLFFWRFVISGKLSLRNVTWQFVTETPVNARHYKSLLRPFQLLSGSNLMTLPTPLTLNELGSLEEVSGMESRLTSQWSKSPLAFVRGRRTGSISDLDAWLLVWHGFFGEESCF